MKRLLEFFATLFESNPGWLARVAGAAGFGLLLGVGVVIKTWRSLPWGVVIAMLVAFPLFAAVAGMLLATADATRFRIRANQRVGFFSRVLFGAGIWSLLVWVIIVFPVGFVLAILLGVMTWNHPPG